MAEDGVVVVVDKPCEVRRDGGSRKKKKVCAFPEGETDTLHALQAVWVSADRAKIDKESAAYRVRSSSICRADLH